MEHCVSVSSLGRPLSFAKLFLHAGQLLLLLLDLLGEQDVLVLEELYLGEQLIHLHRVLLARVLERGQRDVFARDEVLHVFGGVGLLFGREVVVEVHLLDLRLFLLGPLPLLELPVARQSPRCLSPRVLLLYLVDQLLQLEVACQPIAVVCGAARELFPLAAHLFCEFEHAFLVAGLSIALGRRLAVLLGKVFIALLQLLDLARQSANVLVFLPDQFLQRHQLLFL